jgi:hypothetical protein
MTHPIPLYFVEAVLSETLDPSGDNLTSVWRDEGGATTNIYQSCIGSNDSTFAQLRTANLILSVCPTTESRTLRFDMDNPTGNPSAVGQTCQVIARCRVVDPFTTGFTVDLDLSLRESTTQRAIDTNNSLSTSWTDVILSLTQAQINSVGNWDNANVQMTFDACADGVDADIDIEVSRVRIVFS